jgi:cell division protein FtsL
MSRAARARLALGALALVTICFVFVFPTRAYLAQRRQVSHAEHDLKVLRRQNDRLQQQAVELQTPAAIQRMAREQFHLAFPGEQVYQAVPGATTPTAGPVTTTTVAPGHP